MRRPPAALSALLVRRHRPPPGRRLATQPPLGIPPAFHICGAGTAVGKTVLSAALARAAARAATPVAYIKPVQSGYPADDDAAVVRAAAAPAPHLTTATLHALAPAAAPDLAARLCGARPAPDAGILALTRQALAAAAARGAIALVEGAGGVLSPFPSGSLAADALRPLALPAVLVGDPALGGISSTLAAREALVARGYQVPAVVFFERPDALQENAATVQRVVDGEVEQSTSVFSAPELPQAADTPLAEYFQSEESAAFSANLLAHLLAWDRRRMAELADMSATAPAIFWYPFTQHATLAASASPAAVAIDSAHGNTFTAYDPAVHALRPMDDAVGSWWTTGVGHGHPGVARAIGAAAGRYGHVMFPEAAHRPAWRLAQLVLDGPGRGWAARVFFSDNGSTAVEVSLKMAFRKRAHDVPDRARLPMRAVTLHGCYHGDTLGAMDCAPRSDYNELQTPWYEDRGLAFDPPTVAIVDGVWTLVGAEGGGGGVSDAAVFSSREHVFSPSRDGAQYRGRIEAAVDAVLQRDEYDLGALVLEPVLQGSGGMRLIDPAFQRALIRVCRERRIPVVLDEVFTGIWRLGRETAAELLGVTPDIASYAKLLTGGTVPLAVTLATGDVFDAFLGESKREALLHGHSYTAHAVGCAAALESLKTYPRAPLFDAERNRFGEFWDEGLARELSTLSSVRRVTAVGTVLAVELNGVGDRGYCATAGARVSQLLRSHDIFTRPLGNVVYVLCSPLTTRAECARVAGVLTRVLEDDEFDRAADESS